MNETPDPNALPPRPDTWGGAGLRRSSGKRVLLVIGAVVSVLVLLFGILVAWPNRWIIQKYTDKGPHSITYEVTGDGTNATVRYVDADGQVVTQGVLLPWSETITTQTGTPLELQAGQEGGGKITCRLEWEGHTFVFRTSYGSSPTCGVNGPA